jgi:hypothetical protein
LTSKRGGSALTVLRALAIIAVAVGTFYWPVP